MMKESKHRRNFLLRITGTMGFILVILLAIYFLVPKLIDLESIREKIKAGISQKISGAVDFERMEVSLFPRPRILIIRANFSFPGTAEGVVASLRIFPSLRSLLSGEVRIARIQIEAPKIFLTVPEETRDKKKTPLSAQELEEKVSALLKTLTSSLPGTRIVIEDGSIKISDPNRLLFSFQDIEGQFIFLPREASITLTCSSNSSRSIALGIRIDPQDLKGIGTLKLSAIKPQLLMHYFFPDTVKLLGDSEGNLMLSFKMLGFKDVQAEVQGSLPYLTFLNRNEEVLVKGIGISGALSLTDERTEITLNELKAENPRLTLSGSLIFNKTPQSLSLELSGSQVDVPSLRTVALSLAGEVPVIQNIFGYVRGGRLPFVTVRSQGASLEDMGKTASIFIRGVMERGEIFVPGPKLDFKEVNGDCVISKGILEGKNVEGNLGNSQVRDGKLRVGLKGNDAPLHIDAAVKADLAEARNILKRLIKDESFIKEIDRVHSINGEARGRVILGESIAAIKPRVDLSEVFFTAEYQRLPFPLLIKGGQFSYDETRVGVKKLVGALGKSSFAGITGELRLGGAPHIEIPSGQVRIDPSEIYPWLRSFEELKVSLEDVRSVRGVINLDTLKVRGPLWKPKEWHFKLAGKVEDLTLDWAFLPGPALLKRGTIAADEERISLTDARADIIDAALTLSVTRLGYREGHPKTDLTFQGKLGPRSYQWVAKRAEMPRQFSPRNAITIEHAHIALEEGATLFQVKFRVQNGPEITAHVLKDSERLLIKKLTINDASSDATFAFDLQEKTVKLAFAGKLSSETLNRLITAEERPKGRIAGDFRAEIQREKPFRFTAQGKLRGENISLSLKQGVPLTIVSLSIDADGNLLTVESASLMLDNNPFSLRGSLKFTPEDLLIDADLFTDRIEWGKITKTAEAIGKRESKETDSTWDIPVKGALKLKANSFTYDKYTWMPLHANVSLNRDAIDIAVTKATLCGVSSLGALNMTPGNLSFDFQLTADNQELEHTLVCLAGTERDITGMFDLQATVKGQGDKKTLFDSLQGTVEFVARDGRIYYDLSLLKIFDFLEINQILRGFPEIRQEGFAYHSIKAKGDLQHGNLKVKEGIVDGSLMEIVAEGSADLKNEKLDLTVLVAPLRKTDFIIKRIPIVGSILGGTPVSIPLHVSGDFNNPTVSFHPVSAVGSGLLGIIERTIKAPVTLFDPFLPDEKN